MRTDPALTSLSTGSVLLNREGRERLTWLEDGHRRWNVWRAQDELRVLEERLRSVAYSDPFDV